MTRDKEIKIRVTRDEFGYIDDICNTNGITKSEFIRQAITKRSDFNEKGIAQKICAMQSIINRMNSMDVAEEEINLLIKEMNALWQYLN